MDLLVHQTHQFPFQSAHLVKKAAPEIVKTSAEGTPSKDVTLVNGHPDDASSVRSRDTEKEAEGDKTPNDNREVSSEQSPAPGSESAGKDEILSESMKQTAETVLFKAF